MLAAAADAPAGNHHVFAIKKYVLTKVISQITTRRMRPMQRAPRVGFSAFPTKALLEFLRQRSGGWKPGGIYHRFFSAQAGSCIYYFLPATFLTETRAKSFLRNIAKTH